MKIKIFNLQVCVCVAATNLRGAKGSAERRIKMENIGTILVIAILVIIIFFAVKSSIKHTKGEGSCCGGGSSDKPERKRLEGKKLGEKIIYIEGMHCDHCKNSVESAINEIEGARAKVSLKKNTALVSYDREISDEELKAAVEGKDFKVVRIEEVNISERTDNV